MIENIECELLNENIYYIILLMQTILKYARLIMMTTVTFFIDL